MSPRSQLLNSSGPTLSSPRWAGDYLDRDHLIPGGAKIDGTSFSAVDAVTVIVGAAGAAIAATSIPITVALTKIIPQGTVLYFGGVKNARLTKQANIGDVTLTVAALAAAVVGGDTATYAGAGAITIPAGTIVSRLYTERDAGVSFHPAIDTDDEYYLTAFDVSDARRTDDVELYRPNSIVYENYLPAFAAASVAVKAKIRGLYRCSININ